MWDLSEGEDKEKEWAAVREKPLERRIKVLKRGIDWKSRGRIEKGGQIEPIEESGAREL